jgi:membrane protein implicated in regulation of membrane protease activity
MLQMTQVIFWLYPAGLLVAVTADLPDVRAAWSGRDTGHVISTFSYWIALLLSIGFVIFALAGELSPTKGWVAGVIALIISAFLAAWCLRPAARVHR